MFPEQRFLAEPRAGSGGSAIKKDSVVLCPLGTTSRICHTIGSIF